MSISKTVKESIYGLGLSCSNLYKVWFLARFFAPSRPRSYTIKGNAAASLITRTHMIFFPYVKRGFLWPPIVLFIMRASAILERLQEESTCHQLSGLPCIRSDPARHNALSIPESICRSCLPTNNRTDH